MTRIKDAEQRTQAILPDASYIVQAPAGSGKTELLIQRYLRLLATVNDPEEIVSITFTKKAAAEMRSRINAALRQAASGAAPAEEHKQLTFQLARDALSRSQEKNWDILHEPSRMHIQTFDSFCAGIVKRAPLTSELGAMPEITQDPQSYYYDAAKATILSINDENWGKAVRRVLAFLDNNTITMQSLIADMLGRRDQWIRHVFRTGGLSSRRILEDAFSLYSQIKIDKVLTLLTPQQKDHWLSLARYAATELIADGVDSPAAACQDINKFPALEPADLPVWRGLIELVLVKQNTWRKRIDKSIGFYAPRDGRNAEEQTLRKQRKQEIQSLIESLADIPELEQAISEVRGLPEARYTDGEWQIIAAIMDVLRLSIAQLKVHLARDGVTDYQEILLSASRALGEPEQPTDLLLFLDYQIKHILIDEFQDTSISQYEFLIKLTAGWQDNDGRTLFLVGDPMQSIYRFRQAEVGLFLRAQDFGIGNVSLTPLKLEVNFRSNDRVIDWVNSCFARIMPATSDIQTSAISYSPSLSTYQADTTECVILNAYAGASPVYEAYQVAAHIKSIRTKNPEHHVAILVRSKNHLPDIITVLKQNNIAYKAVEIESLTDRQPIIDLISLTSAIYNVYDKISWLGILRAPWCGLTLNELHRTVTTGKGNTVYEQLHDEQIRTLLLSGNSRFAAFIECIDEAFHNRERKPLRRLIQGLWEKLGGPACLQSYEEIEDIECFWTVLDNISTEDAVPAKAVLERQLSRLFAKPRCMDKNPVEIMTIHKSKGLQFDHVIIPCINKSTPTTDRPLLLWEEVVREASENNGVDDLMLAPLSTKYTDHSHKYDFLKKISDAKERNEVVRLLYVAATRAKSSLLISGTFKHKDGNLTAPPGSFSKLLLDDPLMSTEIMEMEDSIAPEIPETPIKRLKKDWKIPAPEQAIITPPESTVSEKFDTQSAIEFDWASEIAMHVGTITHYLLNRISQDNININDIDTSSYTDEIHAALRNRGVPYEKIGQAVKRVISAIDNALNDETGRWILTGKHKSAVSEYALTGIVEGKLVNAVIDRTFVDADNVRWIVDYKTSRHEGAGLDSFLENEKLRYKEQLETYAKLMAGIDKRKIRKALYFPLLQQLVTWD